MPVTQTSTISPYLELAHGLDFGPGVGPRWGSGGTDAGNELNVIGHTATSLAEAITNADYVTFTVNPKAGAGIIPSAVSFQVWRENGASAKDFAIMTSVDNFTTALSQTHITDFNSNDPFPIVNQHTLTAAIPTVNPITEPVEFRLYAWNATQSGLPAPTGNTHINAVSLTAQLKAISSLEFNFSGVQSGAPLTALKRQDANVSLTSGLNFGPGLAPSNNNNVGNEFNVAGFSTGTNAQSAVDGSDYLTFTVQPIAGMTMLLDSASFTLWRQGSGSAIDYAVYSSIGGFAPGQQLAQAHLTATGSANQVALGGTFASSPATTSPVEFRLYGWNAASSLDNTHVTAASMRARFTSIAGSSIDPTGSITVQGDFYHLFGGMLAIDLGGHSAGVDYDTVNVLGKVVLEGNLSVSLADIGGSLFAPSLGDAFNILTATQGITGQFSNVTLPQLPWNLDWHIDYLANAANLTVWSSGDFNHDGSVDGADYVVWRKNGGSEADFNIWRARFGLTADSSSGASNASSTSASVPEPTSALLLILAATILIWRFPKMTRI